MATVAEIRFRPSRPSRDAESQELVERFFDGISSVSSLPGAAMRILEVTGNPHSEAADLLQAVEHDPAIAARIVRIANSSFYSLRRPITDLKAAITMLGFREIRNLALTACVSRLLGSGGRYGTYSREGLWNHCTGVGAAARAIAKACGRVSPGQAYLAGLLHDLGLILIDQHLHVPFCEVLDQLDPNTPTCAAELTIFGFDHTELGSHIGRRWRFPDEVTAAIRYHHQPELCEGPHHRLVYVVGLANFLCALHGLSSLGVRNLPEPPDEVIDGLDLGPGAIAFFHERFEETLAQASLLASV